VTPAQAIIVIALLAFVVVGVYFTADRTPGVGRALGRDDCEGCAQLRRGRQHGEGVAMHTARCLSR
jgi:hypothetical protein